MVFVQVIHPGEKPEFPSAFSLRGADSESQTSNMNVTLSFNEINFDLKDDAYDKALCKHATDDGLNVHTGQVFLPSYEKRANDGLALYDLFWLLFELKQARSWITGYR